MQYKYYLYQARTALSSFKLIYYTLDRFTHFLIGKKKKRTHAHKHTNVA